jgi:hypothetical protein
MREHECGSRPATSKRTRDSPSARFFIGPICSSLGRRGRRPAISPEQVGLGLRLASLRPLLRARSRARTPANGRLRAPSFSPNPGAAIATARTGSTSCAKKGPSDCGARELPASVSRSAGARSRKLRGARQRKDYRALLGPAAASGSALERQPAVAALVVGEPADHPRLNWTRRSAHRCRPVARAETCSVHRRCMRYSACGERPLGQRRRAGHGDRRWHPCERPAAWPTFYRSSNWVSGPTRGAQQAPVVLLCPGSRRAQR